MRPGSQRRAIRRAGSFPAHVVGQWLPHCALGSVNRTRLTHTITHIRTHTNFNHIFILIADTHGILYYVYANISLTHVMFVVSMSAYVGKRMRTLMVWGVNGQVTNCMFLVLKPFYARVRLPIVLKDHLWMIEINCREISGIMQKTWQI